MVDSLMRTPLYEEELRLGARMVEFAGWELPVQYDSILEEHRQVRREAGLFDVSHLGRIEVVGDGALDLLEQVFSNGLSSLAPGRARYSLLCNEAGGIIDDPLVFHRDSGHYLVVCNAANAEKICAWFIRWGGDVAGRVQVHNITGSTAMLALQGPQAGLYLDAISPSLREQLKPFDCVYRAEDGVWVSRTGYTGEDGFELLVGATGAEALWRSLIGQGVKPCGLGARDLLRLEAGFLLYGNEMDEETNPYEVGLGRLVRLDKGRFVGREALARLQEEGLRRRLVGFEVTGKGVARRGHPIVLDGEVVGRVTSGGHVPTLDKNVGLGFVSPELAEPGTELRINIRGRMVMARVVPLPFYRRGRAG